MCVQRLPLPPPGGSTAGDPSSERWNLLGEKLSGNLAESSEFSATSGIFYVQQIYDMGQTALRFLRKKSCWGFFRPEKNRRLRPGLNPRTWVLKASTQPLDQRRRLVPADLVIFFQEPSCFMFHQTFLIARKQLVICVLNFLNIIYF
jgi:hypothetical protein